MLQKLPTDLVFIFKANHIIATHNARAGGTTRNRLFIYTDYCMKAMCEKFSHFYLMYLRIHFKFKVLLFEQWFSLYERLYGWMKVSMDKDGKKLLEETTQ